MTISQRIFMILKEKRLKQKDLSEYTGISTSAISAWNKNNLNPAADKLSIIADFLGVSLSFLITGKEEHESVSEDISQLIKNYNSVDEISKKLIQERAATLAELAVELAAEKEKVQYNKTANKKEPLRFPAKTEQDEEECCYIDICALPAGAGTGVYLDESRTEPLKIVHTNIADRANYAIRVSGDSMEPKFHDGDIVLVETCPSINIGEIGIFIVNGEGFIKQYDGNTLISLNPKRKNIHLQEDDAVFCRGRVLGIAEAAK